MDIDIPGIFQSCGIPRPDHEMENDCLSLCNRFGLQSNEFSDALEAFSIKCQSGFGKGDFNKFVSELQAHVNKKKQRSDQIAKSTDKKIAHYKTPATKRKLDHSITTITPNIVEYDLSTVLNTPLSANVTSGSQQAASFSLRVNSGEVITTYNPHLAQRGDCKESDTGILGLRSEISMNDDEFNNVKQRYRFMYTSLKERYDAAHDHFILMQNSLLEYANVDIADLGRVGVPSQHTLWVCGRICLEPGATKLNTASILLEGVDGRRVALDASTLPQYSLFPGQIVLVEGVNSSGRKMVAKRLVEGAPCPPAQSLPSKLLEYHHSPKYQGGEALRIIAAAGPYSTSDNLTYEPLEELLRQILRTKPDVVILMGPFVDINHPQIATGEVTLDSDDLNKSHVASYEMVFIEKIIRDGLAQFFNVEKDLDKPLPTQIILVPSLSDAHHEFVFPQPPMGQRDPISSKFFTGDDRLGEFKLPYSSLEDPRRRVHMVSNPCMFRINEVLFAITSADVLFSLSSEETASGRSDHKPSRLLSQLCLQHTFLPLLPPSVTSSFQVDYRQASHLRIKVTPDIIITPSKLGQMAKELGGTLLINPGQVAKGSAGGTYADLTIHPIPEDALRSASTGNNETLIPNKVHSRTQVSVVRV